jgi:hypothetical protein
MLWTIAENGCRLWADMVSVFELNDCQPYDKASYEPLASCSLLS